MTPLSGAYDKAYQLEVYTENASWPEQQKLEKSIRAEHIGGGMSKNRQSAVFAIDDCEEAMKKGRAVLKRFPKLKPSFAVRAARSQHLIEKCPTKGEPAPRGSHDPAWAPVEKRFWVSPYGSKTMPQPRPRTQGQGIRPEHYRSPYEGSVPVPAPVRPASGGTRSPFYVSPYSQPKTRRRKRKKTMPKTDGKFRTFYAAVRAHLGPKGERSRAQKALKRQGFEVKPYSGGWAYVRSKASTCGKARQKTNKLRGALKKLKLEGRVGLMALTSRTRVRWSGGKWVPRGGSPIRPGNEVRLRKCPR